MKNSGKEALKQKLDKWNTVIEHGKVYRGEDWKNTWDLAQQQDDELKL